MVLQARFTLLIVGIVILFTIIVARLFYWQVIRGGELAVEATAQYNVLYKISGKRGNIYFRDKSALVINQPGFLLVGYPKQIQNKAILSKSLSPILGEDEASIAARIRDDLYWIPIKHKIDEEKKRKIDESRLAGVGFEEETLRFYPESSMAAHVIGFVGSDLNGEDKGYFGLEGYYDREIKGRGGTVRSIIDALGRPILLGEQKARISTRGRDILLTVDRAVQFIVEDALTKGLEKYGAKGGTVIVIEPATGAVLAIASFPSYDPAKWQDFDQSLYKNPAVAASYEPGSTFKVLVMAAGINENLVEADTKCDLCDGPVSIGGFTIRTWNNKYFKDTAMLEVLQHSDNTGMVFVGKKLGLEKLYSYLEKFGIGLSTGIDLEDEESPLLRPKAQWREIDLATASFGQGVAVTPIQMVRAVAAIANGGKLVVPHLANSVIKENGEQVPIESKAGQEVISEKTAKILTEMMVNAVDNGEAKFAKPGGFRIAGKTGTAQIPISGHYDPTKTIASFVGFAPADDPKFVMLVKVDEPTSSPFGSETAAPLFFDIAKRLFTYYNIPPSN